MDEKPMVVMRDAFKRFTLDQDKVISPEETVASFLEKTRKMDIKILEETVRIDNGRLGIPVYFSVCGEDAARVTGTRKQMGKGATPAQAEASAVMELAERFSFFSFRENPDNFITDTYANVKEKAIPFELIAASVHDTSTDLEVSEAIFEQIPMQWVWGTNLTRGERVLIPFTWFFTINEFNGPSAGNCVEEALMQGISEVVERHVSSLISRNRLEVPLVDPQSATDPMVVEMLAKYEKAGIKLFLSDFTLDMGIPTVGILAYDPETFPAMSEIVWTAGTTPDPQKALSRALTEVAQLAGDFNTAANYVASGLPKFERIEEADFVTQSGKRCSIDDLPNLSDDNIKTEIERCLAALQETGMEVLTIDTMHPKLGIPAFYTIIPGAHFRERALSTSVAMFSAKIVAEQSHPIMAMQQLQQMDAKLPGKYYLQFYLGSCALALEQGEKALAHFTKALELNPSRQDIPSIYSYMGVCLKDMERYTEALDVLAKGIAVDPGRTDLHNLSGFCHFKLKQHEEAIAAFQRVLQLDPTSAIDYANIASNYRDLGERDKAIQYYTLALELDPSIEFARDSLEKLKKKQV